MNTCLDGDFARTPSGNYWPGPKFTLGRGMAMLEKGELRLFYNADLRQDVIPIWFLDFGESTYENLVKSVDFFLEESPFASDLDAIERNFLFDVLHVSKDQAKTLYLYSDHNPYIGQKGADKKLYRAAGYDAVRFHEMSDASALTKTVKDFYAPHRGSHIRTLLEHHIAFMGDNAFKAIPDDLLNAVPVEKFI